MAKLVYKKDRQRQETLDEFVQAGESIVKDVQSNNNRSIVYGIIAVVFVLIVVAVSGEFVEKANIKRSAAVHSVYGNYQRAVSEKENNNVPSFKTAEERKSAILGALDNSKKELADKAFLLLGVEADLAASSGDAAKAEQLLADLKGKLSNTFISEQVELSRINLLEASKKPAEALEEMVKLNATVTDAYLKEATTYHVGRLALLAGKNEQALENFADLKKNYSASLFLPLAVARLEEKGLEIPEEKAEPASEGTAKEEPKAVDAEKETAKSN